MTDNRLPLKKLDWDWNEVQLRDKVIFLTKGKYTSTGSFVKRLSLSHNYFIAVIGEFENVVKRKSCNISVV